MKLRKNRKTKSSKSKNYEESLALRTLQLLRYWSKTFPIYDVCQFWL